MKKIPTIFLRDESRRGVINEWNPDCLWVRDGAGVATRKWDGTSCLYQDGRLWKRRELRPGDEAPVGFLLAGTDAETGKTVGWVPVGDGPDDRWHREALNAPLAHNLEEGQTYELVGPKVNGNKDGTAEHRLIPHGNHTYAAAPRTFDELKAWLAEHEIEGVVWHHQSGRMAKIKRRDFGLKW